MPEKRSTERERTLVGAFACRHPDTVKRYVSGLNVAATTREAIEGACSELDYEHFLAERLRALAARKAQP